MNHLVYHLWANFKRFGHNFWEFERKTTVEEKLCHDIFDRLEKKLLVVRRKTMPLSK